MDLSNPIFQLIISALLGAFVGIRREVDLQKNNTVGFRGLRTTALITVFGTVSTLLPQIPNLPIVSFIALLIGIIIVYWKGIKNGKIGMTSEISMILMFLSGIFIGYEEFILGIILALLVAISDAYKNSMHNFAKKLKLEEWVGTLEMIIISLVVLPFLPKTPIDPWGIIIPYDIWLIVVLVTGIGFLGYFLNKIFKQNRTGGIYLTAFVGSLISSTVVTVKLAQLIKDKKISLNEFIPAIMLSISVMQFRILILIFIVTHSFIISFIVVPLVMAITSLILFGVFLISNKKNKKNSELKIEESSPFEIVPALKFGLLFAVVLVIIYFSNKYFGEKGVYITSFFVALVDVESIILPTLESFNKSDLMKNIVVNVLAIVVIINTVVKLFYIWIFAGKKYFWKILFPLLIIIFSGIIAWFLI